MTIEEIKSTYTMRDVLDMYGLKANRSGFICCPFHGEKTASFKVYERSFHCFGCGVHGDVIDFVAKMDDCTFEDAFRKLGGTREKPKKSDLLRTKRRKAERKRGEVYKAAASEKYQDVCEDLQMLRRIQQVTRPFSELWTFVTNKIVALEYNADYLTEEMRR